MLKIGLVGSAGRMGRAIKEIIENESDKYQLACEIGRGYSAADLKQLCEDSDVILDFSSPDILKELTTAVAASNAKLLVGTTGLKGEHFEYLKKLSKTHTVLFAPNTSLAANLVAAMAAKAAKVLGGYDAEIIEAHHKHKKDAPSGMALVLGQEIAKARGVGFEENAVMGREGNAVRKDNEIGISSIRGGGIFGEHEVMFANEYETFSISSRALTRAVFASGALTSAAWLSRQKAGYYLMRDVLGI